MTFTYIIHTHQLGKPLLVIQPPGWGLGATYLRRGLSPLLENHFTLLYFIPRGTSGSSRPRESEMGTWTMADDLELLRRHLHLQKFPALFGHSNGGAIVLAYAEKFPLRVDKIVLLSHRLIGLTPDTSLMMQGREDPRYEDAYDKKRRGDESATDEEATQYWKDILPLYFFDPARGVPEFLDAMGPDLVSAWCRQAQSACDAQELRRPPRKPMVEKLKDVKAKVLIIFGKFDMICAVDNGEQTQRGLPPGAELKVYDRCGHFPWIERPENIAEDIVGFLDG
jgi:pimeloyl-ACP methyl ester carboxylesterase